MAKKLGEILMEQGVINATELKKALDAQLIFGGRLGTNLIELGFVDEPTLMSALESQKSTGVATAGQFDAIPSEVIRMIPKSLVRRHRLVPIALDDRTITVAMADPNDLVVLDEITFVTGKKVQALLATEARLLEAMETYYGLARPSRFVTLSEEIRAQMAGPAELSAGAAPVPAQPWAVDMGRPDTPDAELVRSTVDAAYAEEATEESRASAQDALEELQRRQQEIREEERRAALESVVAGSMEDAADALSHVETRDEIGDVLLDYAKPRADRVAVFILQKARTLGWNARGEGTEWDRIRSTVIPRDQPSVFDALTAGSSYYLGAVEEVPGNELLVQGLGGRRPEVALVMPIPFQDRIIGALYADGPMERLKGVDVRAFRTLCRKAGLAMELLVLRHRILQ